MKTTFRKLRERRGLTQDELAERLRVSQPTVSNLENGVRHLHPELAAKASRVFGVGAWELQELHSREVHAIALKSALAALKELGMDEPRKLAAVLATPNGRRLVRTLTTKAIEAGDDETAQSVMGAVEKAVGSGGVDAALKTSSKQLGRDDDEPADSGRDAFGRRRRAASKDRDSFGRSKRFASSEKSRDSLGRARDEDVVERDRFGRRVRKTFSGDQRASAEANEESERQERERRAEQEWERQESERAAWAERQERQARQARAARSAEEMAAAAAEKVAGKLADGIVRKARRGQRGRELTAEERSRVERIMSKPV